jgi:hypothetical protein
MDELMERREIVQDVIDCLISKHGEAFKVELAELLRRYKPSHKVNDRGERIYANQSALKRKELCD